MLVPTLALSLLLLNICDVVFLLLCCVFEYVVVAWLCYFGDGWGWGKAFLYFLVFPLFRSLCLILLSCLNLLCLQLSMCVLVLSCRPGSDLLLLLCKGGVDVWDGSREGDFPCVLTNSIKF